MYQYPKELKESITARMLPPNSVGVPAMVQETGIPKDTLYSWRNKARKGKVSSQSTNNGQLNSEEKFNAVMETAAMNEVELSKYCRSKGIFPLQINAWRKTCMNAHAPLAPKADRAAIRSQAKKIKGLEKELRRKEKALAEAAALLILQKKVQFLWQDQGEEKPALRSVRK
jgi:transposase